jgi:hypothetical protein
MNDGDTNPNLVSLGRVFTEIRDMRKENKVEHKTITQTLNAHSVQLACLETKWATFWKVLKWAAPIMGIAIGAAVGVNWLLKGGM